MPGLPIPECDFLCFAICDGSGTHGQSWHAIVGGVQYGPYDEKQEMLARICWDLSAQKNAREIAVGAH